MTLSNISIGYPNKTILEKINISFKPGTIYGLMGINGIGKTTFLKTISGILEPIHGTITIAQKEIHKISLTEKSKYISNVFTDEISNFNLSVLEIVSLGRQPYTNWLGEITEYDKKIIQQAIAITQTEELQLQKYHQLSDGQKQRVLIARALAQDTPILILDEPTSHLDISHKINIFKILKNIAQESNKTILIATHELNICLQYCHEMMILDQKSYFTGKSTAKNTIEKIKTLFETPDFIYHEGLHQFIFTNNTYTNKY